jgi:hypothetical protein
LLLILWHTFTYLFPTAKAGLDPPVRRTREKIEDSGGDSTQDRRIEVRIHRKTQQNFTKRRKTIRDTRSNKEENQMPNKTLCETPCPPR